MDRNSLGMNIILCTTVALRKESVDRNFQICIVTGRLLQVALRKESVDRNKRAEPAEQAQGLVALRKESVDRNHYSDFSRLWRGVALRKESVDRNLLCCLIIKISFLLSLSARRAWIEIFTRNTLAYVS